MSLNVLPETLMNANFCFVSRDIPDEKHASSFRTYSLNVAPRQHPIFWIQVSEYPARAKALAPPLCRECVFTRSIRVPLIVVFEGSRGQLESQADVPRGDIIVSSQVKVCRDDICLCSPIHVKM